MYFPALGTYMDYFFNPKIEKLPRTKIKELQIKRLKETVKHTFENIPFYKKKFRDLKIKPEDIKTLDDIHKLPFTKKDDLRDNAPFGFWLYRWINVLNCMLHRVLLAYLLLYVILETILRFGLKL